MRYAGALLVVEPQVVAPERAAAVAPAPVEGRRGRAALRADRAPLGELPEIGARSRHTLLARVAQETDGLCHVARHVVQRVCPGERVGATSLVARVARGLLERFDRIDHGPVRRHPRRRARVGG